MNKLFIVPALILIFSLAATNIGLAEHAYHQYSYEGKYEPHNRHKFQGRHENPGHRYGHHNRHGHRGYQEHIYGRFNRHGHHDRHDYRSRHYYPKYNGYRAPLYYVIPGFIGANIFFGY